MTYEENNIRKWLIEHSLINISKLENFCDMPKDTLRHFKEERRKLPNKHIDKLIIEISKYGFVGLNEE